MTQGPTSAARLSRPPAPPRRQLLLGYAASVGAALSFALGALVVRKAVTDFTTPLVTVAYSMLVACAVLAVLAGRGAVAEMARAPRVGWALAVAAGTISSAAAISYYFALNFAPVVLVSPVSGTAPLFAMLFTIIFLKRLESVTPRMIAGCVLVVAGVALIAMGRS